ncbi:MAG TPA: pyridoxamine 5'-phosphate oxidase family protein [Candidatus Limnocylindria bacterium]|jgi:hypothetical protein|nr:pyridoxamine 5'-phosphate oxidase family protein [Candidatus Limnocylindria bacterium]
MTTSDAKGSALTDRGAMEWSAAEERLANPNAGRTYWLATVRRDGAPHLMPVIGTWDDGTMYVLTGAGSQKGRNLAHESRCVIGVSAVAELPSMDVILEGRAERIADEAGLRRVAEMLGTKGNWPLEVVEGGLSGPHAPTAGPPPYAVYRVTPSKVFALPGTEGMFNFKPEDLPAPTRFDFG